MKSAVILLALLVVAAPFAAAGQEAVNLSQVVSQNWTALTLTLLRSLDLDARVPEPRGEQPNREFIALTVIGATNSMGSVDGIAKKIKVKVNSGSRTVTRMTAKRQAQAGAVSWVGTSSSFPAPGGDLAFKKKVRGGSELGPGDVLIVADTLLCINCMPLARVQDAAVAALPEAMKGLAPLVREEIARAIVAHSRAKTD